MIADKQMIDLGFIKQKTFKKKEIGVSSYSWIKNNCFEFTIEKNLGADFGDDCFLPTFRNYKSVWYFTELEDVKNILKALNINN